MVVDYPDPEEGWDVVREWLQSHDFNETKAAIEYKGEFDTTALHVACRNRPPKDVIDVMIMASPDMIFWADSFGWLPLHYACANGAEIDVVGALLEAYPDSKLTTDKRGRTPLHFALGNVEQPPTAMLVQLLAGKEMKSSSVRWPDENNMLPLHYACAYGASVEVLRVIIDAWDESLSKVDNKGRTPLHFAMGNAHRDNSPEVVKLLLDLHPAGVNVMDVEKNLPLNLLSSKAESVEQNQIKTRDCVKKCLNLYLKAKPSTCIEFLTAIQKMPEWVRDIAVIHPTVQTMLNVKISSRFPTMILLLDFYFLAMVIGCFSFTAQESIDRRFNKQNTTAQSRSVSVALLSPLYIGSVYFLGREILQMISVRQQTTIISYLADPENAVNLAFVFMTTYFTICMQTGMGDDNRFRQGAGITIGLCYAQVLAYFKITAFAQMWLTIFQQSSECDFGDETEANVTSRRMQDAFEYYYDDMLIEEGPEDCEPSIDAPYCSGYYWAWYKTYTMMLGEIDDTLFYWNTFSLILFCIFYFFVVILLLNILIAIITDLYGVITNDRAAIVFWSNRLAFLTDMDLITNGPWKKTIMNFFRLGDDDDENEEEALLGNDKVEITWERILWKKLIECFDPEVDNQGVGLFFYVPLRIFIAMFLIPFWLLVGIISAGWLWPPQVREGLFVQAVSIPEDSGEIREVEKRIEEVSGLRKDLEYVQGGMVNDFKQDRKDMTELKNQVKGIKKELKKEMKNIKQVMTSLFEVQQQAMMS
eukprot:scaffold14308_cov138-Skeletonema_marinoi.AAC.5